MNEIEIERMADPPGAGPGWVATGVETRNVYWLFAPRTDRPGWGSACGRTGRSTTSVPLDIALAAFPDDEEGQRVCGLFQAEADRFIFGDSDD